MRKTIILFLTATLTLLFLNTCIAQETKEWNKCISPVSKTFNIKDFGARGDGVTDDRATIQKAIDSASNYGPGNLVLIPNGVYMIDAVNSLRLNNNINLHLEDNAVLKAIPNNSTYYAIVKIMNAQNVSVDGGTIDCEREQHLGTTGEWGMGIDVRGSSMVIISNMLIKDAWGDGLYLGGAGNGSKVNNNIIIENVICDNNRRQGISVITGENILIEDSVLKNTKGTSPAAGLDMEPNNPEYEPLKNIIIKNLSTIGNSGYGVLMAIFRSTGFYVSVINHVDSGSYGPYGIAQTSEAKGIFVYNGDIKKINCLTDCPEKPVCNMDTKCDIGEDLINCPWDCGACVTGLNELQTIACKAANEAGTCDKLSNLGIITAEQCCTYLQLCCSPTTVTLAELKDALIKAIINYFKNPNNPALTVPEIKDLIVTYLTAPGDTVDLSGTGRYSGEKLIDIYNKAKNIVL